MGARAKERGDAAVRQKDFQDTNRRMNGPVVLEEGSEEYEEPCPKKQLSPQFQHVQTQELRNAPQTEDGCVEGISLRIHVL